MIGTDKENVVISAGACTLSVLPHLGGKISSIKIRGRELLHGPLAPLAPRTQTMPFDAGDASGWDECLPSVVPCQVQLADGTADIPDHGDLWRVEWKEQGSGSGDQGSEIRLRGECFSLPLAVDRRLVLNEKEGGWQLDLDYKITNTGGFRAPWSWAAHPLFVMEPGDRLILPESIHTLRLAGSTGGRLGKTNDTVSWPMAKLAGGGETDLRVAQGPGSGIGEKLFAGPLRSEENWCALERPSAGVRIKVSFETAAIPYLGLWICYGGWPDRPGPKQTCVAPEPSTAAVDSLAESGSWSRALDPGESFEWNLQVDFELI